MAPGRRCLQLTERGLSEHVEGEEPKEPAGGLEPDSTEHAAHPGFGAHTTALDGVIGNDRAPDGPPTAANTGAAAGAQVALLCPLTARQRRLICRLAPRQSGQDRWATLSAHLHERRHRGGLGLGFVAG